MIRPGMAGRMRLRPSLRKPSPTSRGWRGATNSACSCVYSRWRKWKLRNTCGFAASGTCREQTRRRSGRKTPPAFCLRIWPQLRIAIAQQPAVPGAKFELPHRPALVAIDEPGREALAGAGKFLAPLPQRDQHRKYPAALRGQHIFLIGAAVGSGRRRQDALVHQSSEPHGQDVLRQPKVLLKFAEAANA